MNWSYLGQRDIFLVVEWLTFAHRDVLIALTQVPNLEVGRLVPPLHRWPALVFWFIYFFHPLSIFICKLTVSPWICSIFLKIVSRRKVPIRYFFFHLIRLLVFIRCPEHMPWSLLWPTQPDLAYSTHWLRLYCPLTGACMITKPSPGTIDSPTFNNI